MNWGLGTKSYRPIGLDIGHNSIKMIQLAVSGERLIVVAADKMRFDAGVNGDKVQRRKTIISAIEKMLLATKFRGRDVVSCLPNDRLWITSFRLAETEDDKIEQVLNKEVVHRFGLDPSKDAINYIVAGSIQQGEEIKNELILFAAPNEAVKEHIEMLEEAQLRPVAIDTIPCALFRCFERSLRRQEDKEQTAVFVDVGSQFTTVVFGYRGEIIFVKQIAIGGERFNQEVAAKLGVSVNEAEMLRGNLRMEPSADADGDSGTSREETPVAVKQGLDVSTRRVITDAVGMIAEELAKEISLCFKYYTVTFRGKRIERAVVTGGEAYENILLNVLRQQLAVDIKAAQPLKGFDVEGINFDSDKQDLLCEWAVAVGLSMKGWSGITSQ